MAEAGKEVLPASAIVKKVKRPQNSPSFPNISADNFGVFSLFVYMAHGAKFLRHAPYLT